MHLSWLNKGSTLTGIFDLTPDRGFGIINKSVYNHLLTGFLKWYRIGRQLKHFSKFRYFPKFSQEYWEEKRATTVLWVSLFSFCEASAEEVD